MAVTPASPRSLRNLASSAALSRRSGLPSRPAGRQHRRAQHDGPGVPGHLGGRDPAGQGGDDPGLAAAGGKQPQRGDLGAAPSRRAWPAPGSGRLEVNSSDPSGRNRGLASPSADRVSRRGGPPPGSIRHRLVRYFFRSGAQRLHRRRQPAPVRRQPQGRHPRYRDEVRQVVERGRGPAALGRRFSAHSYSPDVDKPQFGPYPSRSASSHRQLAGANGASPTGDLIRSTCCRCGAPGVARGSGGQASGPR